MRTAFIETLLDLAVDDPRIWLVVGDLGFGVVTDFAEKLPDQFVNAGVAEQNMTGLAAGLALEGQIPFTYSIANFPTLRAVEQIRNDVCYHDLNVRIVAVGGGFAYGQLGMSHHATEDIAIMRVIPGMTVIAPGDPAETIAATRAVINFEGPCYLRLGRAGERTVHEQVPADFEIGRAITVRSGSDVTVISTGGMLPTSVDVADQLESEGVSVRLLSMHTVSPIDVDAISDAAGQTRAVVTVEEHSVVGGLGGAVAEVLAELQTSVKFVRIGAPREFADTVGDQDFLRRRYGLDDGSIKTRILQLLG